MIIHHTSKRLIKALSHQDEPDGYSNIDRNHCTSQDIGLSETVKAQARVQRYGSKKMALLVMCSASKKIQLTIDLTFLRISKDPEITSLLFRDLEQADLTTKTFKKVFEIWVARLAEENQHTISHIQDKIAVNNRIPLLRKMWCMRNVMELYKKSQKEKPTQQDSQMA